MKYVTDHMQFNPFPSGGKDLLSCYPQLYVNPYLTFSIRKIQADADKAREKGEEENYKWLLSKLIVFLAEARHYDDDAYMEWTQDDLRSMMQIMILVIDPESPIAQENRSFDARISKAIIVLKNRKHIGISLPKKVITEVRAMGPYFRLITFEYFKIIHDIDYKLWVAKRMNYMRLLEYISKDLSPTSVETQINARRSIEKDLGKITTDLKELEVRLFDDQRLLKSMNEAQNLEEVSTYAEMYAEDPEWKR